MKRFISGGLSLVTIIVLCANIIFTPADAVSLREEEIQQKIDDYYSIVTENGTKKAYWNMGQNEKTLKAFADQKEYEKSVSNKACPVKVTVLANGERQTSHALGTTCTSNIFNSSSQCHGFARYMCYVIFGSAPAYAAGDPKKAISGKSKDGWTTYTKDMPFPTIQAGDFIRYNGHSAVVYSVSNEVISVIDCNHGPSRPCEIDICNLWGEWKVSTLKTAYNKGNAYICRYGGEIDPGGDNLSITVTTGAADGITETAATLRGDFRVSNGYATQCGMYLGTSENNMTKLGSDKLTNSTGVPFYYNTSKHGQNLQPGTIYYYKAYALVNGKEYTGAPKTFTTVPAMGAITLNKTELSMKKGEQASLFATTVPGGQRVTWSSSDPAVAKVSNGTVTGVKGGTATITARMTYHNKAYSAACNITVQEIGNVKVTTKGADHITHMDAVVRGEVSSSGAKATECGMYFGTSKDSLTKLGSDSINANNMPFYYSANKYGRKLNEETTYYYQAYAVVDGKTYWGDIKSFITEKSPVSVVVTTKGADNITKNNAIVRGEVTVNGAKATECGMYFGTSEGSLTKLGSDTINTSDMPFYYGANKYGQTLSAGTTYYYQAYAVVGGDTYWGEVKSFSTKAEEVTAPAAEPESTPTPMPTSPPPSVDVTVTTKAADGITQIEAIVRGEVTTSGAKATECGMYFGTSKNNLTKLGSDPINANSMPFYYSCVKYGRTLSAGTTYYYQAYAIVDGNTYWGDIKSFITEKNSVSVTVTTKGADNITKTSAVVRGEVTTSGAKATECGMYFGTSANDLTFLGSDSINATNMPFYYGTGKYGRTLSAGTTYYYQAYAIVDGTTYRGEVKSFTTARN